MNVRQLFGAGLLIAVIAVVIAVNLWRDEDSESASAPDGLTVVKGYGGRLKASFANDPEVIAILAERYGLTMDVTAEGSIALACGRSYGPDDDFVWLGDSVALEVYKACPNHDRLLVDNDNVYNSPIVLYTWAPIVDALVTAGLARAEPDGSYSVDFALLVELMNEQTTWADLGLPDLHGKVLVQTTDPRASNSGFLFGGMLANALNGGDVVNGSTIGPLLPDVQTYFARLGYMEKTSGTLFQQYLITGMGAKPIIALYESQIPEFLHQNPEYTEQVIEEVRILYPRPTVWATHPLVARTDDGARLLEALKDPEIQQLAWTNHGQRPGVAGVPIDRDVIQIPGIVTNVSSVISMPGRAVMDQIIAAVDSPPAGVPPTPASSPTGATPATLPDE